MLHAKQNRTNEREGDMNNNIHKKKHQKRVDKSPEKGTIISIAIKNNDDNATSIQINWSVISIMWKCVSICKNNRIQSNKLNFSDSKCEKSLTEYFRLNATVFDLVNKFIFFLVSSATHTLCWMNEYITMVFFFIYVVAYA